MSDSNQRNAVQEESRQKIRELVKLLARQQARYEFRKELEARKGTKK